MGFLKKKSISLCTIEESLLAITLTLPKNVMYVNMQCGIFDIV
jgi:hypothetical protein